MQLFSSDMTESKTISLSIIKKGIFFLNSPNLWSFPMALPIYCNGLDIFEGEKTLYWLSYLNSLFPKNVRKDTIRMADFIKWYLSNIVLISSNHILPALWISLLWLLLFLKLIRLIIHIFLLFLAPSSFAFWTILLIVILHIFLAVTLFIAFFIWGLFLKGLGTVFRKNLDADGIDNYRNGSSLYWDGKWTIRICHICYDFEWLFLWWICALSHKIPSLRVTFCITDSISWSISHICCSYYPGYNHNTSTHRGIFSADQNTGTDNWLCISIVRVGARGWGGQTDPCMKNSIVYHILIFLPIPSNSLPYPYIPHA